MPINEVQILPFYILNLGQFLENGCLVVSFFANTDGPRPWKYELVLLKPQLEIIFNFTYVEGCNETRLNIITNLT